LVTELQSHRLSEAETRFVWFCLGAPCKHPPPSAGADDGAEVLRAAATATGPARGIYGLGSDRAARSQLSHANGGVFGRHCSTP